MHFKRLRRTIIRKRCLQTGLGLFALKGRPVSALWEEQMYLLRIGTVEEICRMIDLVSDTMDDYLYICDFQNDFYYIRLRQRNVFYCRATRSMKL